MQTQTPNFEEACKLIENFMIVGVPQEKINFKTDLYDGELLFSMFKDKQELYQFQNNVFPNGIRFYKDYFEPKIHSSMIQSFEKGEQSFLHCLVFAEKLDTESIQRAYQERQTQQKIEEQKKAEDKNYEESDGNDSDFTIKKKKQYKICQSNLKCKLRKPKDENEDNDSKLKSKGMFSKSHLAYQKCMTSNIEDDDIDLIEMCNSGCFPSQIMCDQEASLQEFYYLPVSLIIETKIENHSIFKPILGQLMDIIKKSTGKNGTFPELVSYICFLKTIVAPVFNSETLISMKNEQLSIKEEAIQVLPMKCFRSMKVLIECLDFKVILKCITGLLHFHSLAVISENQSLLFDIVDGLKQLMFPFVLTQFSQALPTKIDFDDDNDDINDKSAIKMFISSPTQMVLGALNENGQLDHEPFIDMENEESSSFVDIDASTYWTKVDIPTFPEQQKLLKRLNKIKNPMKSQYGKMNKIIQQPKNEEYMMRCIREEIFRAFQPILIGAFKTLEKGQQNQNYDEIWSNDQFLDNVLLAQGAKYSHLNYAKQLIGQMSFEYFLNDGGFSNEYFTNFDLVNSILFSRGHVNCRVKQSSYTVQKFSPMIEEQARKEKNLRKLKQLNDIYKKGFNDKFGDFEDECVRFEYQMPSKAERAMIYEKIAYLRYKNLRKKLKRENFTVKESNEANEDRIQQALDYFNASQAILRDKSSVKSDRLPNESQFQTLTMIKTYTQQAQQDTNIDVQKEEIQFEDDQDFFERILPQATKIYDDDGLVKYLQQLFQSLKENQKVLLNYYLSIKTYIMNHFEPIQIGSECNSSELFIRNLNSSASRQSVQRKSIVKRSKDFELEISYEKYQVNPNSVLYKSNQKDFWFKIQGLNQTDQQKIFNNYSYQEARIFMRMASTYEKLNRDYSNEMKLALILKHPFVWSSISSKMILSSYRDEKELKIQDQNSKFRLVLEMMFPQQRLKFILDSMSREQIMALHNILQTDQAPEKTAKFPFIQKYTSTCKDQYKLNNFFTDQNERSRVPIYNDILLLIVKRRQSEVLQKLQQQQEIIENDYRNTPESFKNFETVEDLCFQCDIQQVESIQNQTQIPEEELKMEPKLIQDRPKTMFKTIGKSIKSVLRIPSKNKNDLRVKSESDKSKNFVNEQQMESTQKVSTDIYDHFQSLECKNLRSLHIQKTLQKGSSYENILNNSESPKETMKDPIKQSLDLLTAILDFWRDPENQKMLSKKHYYDTYNEMGSKKNLVSKRQSELLKIFKTEILKFEDFEIKYGTIENDDFQFGSNDIMNEYSSLQKQCFFLNIYNSLILFKLGEIISKQGKLKKFYELLNSSNQWETLEQNSFILIGDDILSAYEIKQKVMSMPDKSPFVEFGFFLPRGQQIKMHKLCFKSVNYFVHIFPKYVAQLLSKKIQVKMGWKLIILPYILQNQFVQLQNQGQENVREELRTQKAILSILIYIQQKLGISVSQDSLEQEESSSVNDDNDMCTVFSGTRNTKNNPNPQQDIQNYVRQEMEELAQNIEEVIQDITKNIQENNLDDVYYIDYVAQVQKLKSQKLISGLEHALTTHSVFDYKYPDFTLLNPRRKFNSCLNSIIQVLYGVDSIKMELKKNSSQDKALNAIQDICDFVQSLKSYETIDPNKVKRELFKKYYITDKFFLYDLNKLGPQPLAGQYLRDILEIIRQKSNREMHNPFFGLMKSQDLEMNSFWRKQSYKDLSQDEIQSRPKFSFPKQGQNKNWNWQAPKIMIMQLDHGDGDSLNYKQILSLLIQTPLTYNIKDLYPKQDYDQYTLKALVSFDENFTFKTYVKKNMYQMDVWKKYQDDQQILLCQDWSKVIQEVLEKKEIPDLLIYEKCKDVLEDLSVNASFALKLFENAPKPEGAYYSKKGPNVMMNSQDQQAAKDLRMASAQNQVYVYNCGQCGAFISLDQFLCDKPSCQDRCEDYYDQKLKPTKQMHKKFLEKFQQLEKNQSNM